MNRVGALCWSVAAALVAASPTVAAAAPSSLPTIDLQARCRKSEAAVVEMMGDPSLRATAFDTCMKSEQEALAALLKAWPDMPPSYKTFCIRPNDYSPSYVEWLACVEMTIDVRKQRASAGTQLDYISKRCPIIQYTPDGSIKNIKACPL